MGLFDSVAGGLATMALGYVGSKVQSKVNDGFDSVLKGIFKDPLSLPTPMMGGISAEMNRTLQKQYFAERLQRKNLFFLEITDFSPLGVVGALTNGLSGLSFNAIKDGIAGIQAPYKFNLFAVNANYSSHTLSGEKIPIGSAKADMLTGREAIELRLTTLDDDAGTLKHWFAHKAQMAAHSDGTFGLPVDYIVKIKIGHAYCLPGLSEIVGYTDVAYYRCASIEHDLNRSEDAMNEIQMSFTQFNTYMDVAGFGSVFGGLFD